MIPKGDNCVLLFSGGRDSTVAALRLASRFKHLVLVTVRSPHMIGMERLQFRIGELRRTLKNQCEWMLIPETGSFHRATAAKSAGCISCHFGYFWIASALAHQLRCDSIACGFVAYQSDWVEQTPYAIQRLSEFLQQRKQRLLLPVLEIQSRAQVEAELESHGLSTDSHELKCVRQHVDPGLTGEKLKAMVDSWAEKLRAAVTGHRSPIQPERRITVSGENCL